MNGIELGFSPTLQELKAEEARVADRLMDDFGNSVDAIGVMASIHSLRGEFSKAIDAWEACLEITPQRHDIHLAIGKAALLQGDHEKSVAASRKALVPFIF